MDTLDQNEASVETSYTRKHFKTQLPAVGERNYKLPSIKNNCKNLNLSVVPDSQVLRQGGSVSPTRLFGSMVSANEEYCKFLSRLSKDERYELRKSVYRDTVQCVQRGFYYNSQEAIVPLPKPEKLSQKFSEFPVFDRPYDSTEIKIYNGDCLDAALKLRSSYNPVLLNMANNYVPGGGVVEGCGAQEESLFRRSDYFSHLDHSLYPIDGAIYSPEVCVFRQSEACEYSFMPNPEKISMIACSALKRPVLTEGDYSQQDRETMLYKMRMILSVSCHFRHDAVVLSAFGCGAFRNPAVKVAEMFKDLLENEFSGCFRKVVFAIFNDHNSFGTGNLLPFEKVFQLSSELSLELI